MHGDLCSAVSVGAIERGFVRMIPSVWISDVRRVVWIWVMKKTSLKILFLEKKKKGSEDRRD